MVFEKSLGENKEKPAKLEKLPEKDEDIPVEFRGSPAVVIRYKEAAKIVKSLEKKEGKQSKIDMVSYVLNGQETDASFGRLSEAIRNGTALSELRDDWDRRRTDLDIRSKELESGKNTGKLMDVAQPGIRMGREVILRLLDGVEVTAEDRELKTEKPEADQEAGEEEGLKTTKPKEAIKPEIEKGDVEPSATGERPAVLGGEKPGEKTGDKGYETTDFSDSEKEFFESAPIVSQMQEMLDNGAPTLRVEDVPMPELISSAESFLAQKQKRLKGFEEKIKKDVAGKHYQKKFSDEYAQAVISLNLEINQIELALESMRQQGVSAEQPEVKKKGLGARIKDGLVKRGLLDQPSAKAPAEVEAQKMRAEQGKTKFAEDLLVAEKDFFAQGDQGEAEGSIEELGSLVPRLQEALAKGDATMRLEGVRISELIKGADALLKQKMAKENAFREEIKQRLGNDYDVGVSLSKMIDQETGKVPDAWEEEVMKLRTEMMTIASAIESMKAEQQKKYSTEDAKTVEQKLQKAI